VRYQGVKFPDQETVAGDFLESVRDGRNPPAGRAGDWRLATTSLATAFVLHEMFEQLKVAGVPIAKVSFLDHDGSGHAPTECCLIDESNIDVKNAFLESVLHSIHNFPVNTGILFALGWQLWFRCSALLYLSFVHLLNLNFRRT